MRKRKQLSAVLPQVARKAAEPAQQKADKSMGNQFSLSRLGMAQAMPEAVQSKMEESFGTDFSDVRLFESSLVSEHGAQAVASGKNIAFAPGQLDLNSRSGLGLLGHELSHVASQSRGEVTGSGFLNDSALEHRADTEGAQAASAFDSLSGQTLTPMSAGPALSSPAAPVQAKKGEKAQKRRNEELELASIWGLQKLFNNRAQDPEALTDALLDYQWHVQHSVVYDDDGSSSNLILNKEDRYVDNIYSSLATKDEDKNFLEVAKILEKKRRLLGGQLKEKNQANADQYGEDAATLYSRYSDEAERYGDVQDVLSNFVPAAAKLSDSKSNLENVRDVVKKNFGHLTPESTKDDLDYHFLTEDIINLNTKKGYSAKMAENGKTNFQNVSDARYKHNDIAARNWQRSWVTEESLQDAKEVLRQKRKDDRKARRRRRRR